MVMGESGLFGKANKAKEQTQISTAKEIIGMQVLENEAYKSTNDSKAKSDEELLQPIEDKLAEEGYKIENGKIKIGDTEINIAEEIANASSESKNRIKGKNDDSKNRTLAGTTTGYSYKNPVIPQGFKAIDTNTAKWTYTDKTQTEVKGWDEGLVIQDTIGNEFVWVPVDGTNVKYEKWCTIGYSYSDCSDDTSAIPVTEENAQIDTYQGFYVARYEAGLTTETLEQNADTNNNTNSTAVSKPGTKIWNYINYNNANTAAQAMINNSETYGTTKSGLVTGNQWDTIMNWYQNTGIKVDKTQDWGTYRNLTYNGNGKYFAYSGSNPITWSEGVFERTGNSAHPSYPYYYHASGLNTNGIKKNIADLGGNFWEWTAENYALYNVTRGSSAGDSTTDYPASSRSYNSMGNTLYYLGFRVVLYIQ